MVCTLREDPHRFAVRIEAAVLREKRIDKDDLVIGLVAHQLLRPGLACAW